MKYVCIDYRPDENTYETHIFSDNNIDNKFSMYDQTFVTHKGHNYAVQFVSDDINKISDFVTVLKIGYKGLDVRHEPI